MFWNLLLFVGFTILSELLRPKPDLDVPDPSSIGDFQLPTAQEGRPIPVVWGTCMIRAPNVIWYGGLSVIPITETVKTGFFSKQTVIKGYNYFLTIHVVLCHGPLGVSGEEGLLSLANFEVRFDDRAAPAVLNDQLPIYATPDARAFGETIVLPSSRAEAQYFFLDSPYMFGGPDKEGGIQLDCLLYPGGFWNGPSAILQGHLGADIPAYRGIAHAVLRGYVGNSSYIKPVAFIVPRCPSPKLFLDGDTTEDANAVIGLDANPAYIVLEILTDTEWGLGIPSALIDLDSFYAVAATLKTEQLGMSYMLEQTTEAASIISDVLRHIDAVLYTDPASGLITLVLVRQDYVVDDLPVFDKSNIATCDMSRGSWSETKNSVKVIYIEGGLTESFDDTIMLVHFNGIEGATTAVDETGNATDPITFNGNAHIDADHPLLGGQALYLDGAGDSVSISWPVHQEFWTNNGVFTIEMLFEPDGAYPEVNASLIALFHNVCTGDFGINLFLTRSDHPTLPDAVELEWKTAAGCSPGQSLSVPFVNDSEAHWIRFSFDGTTMSLSIDAGVEVATVASTTFSGFTPGMIVGRHPQLNQQFFKGWIKEIRITAPRARPAVYTLPTSQFPYPEINITGRGSFEERAVQQQNLANIEARGGEMAQEVIRFLGLSNSANANKVAARVLKTISYPLATFKLVANRDAWALRPGSVFRLTWEPLGITDMAVRVTRIGYGELLNGRIEIDAAEDIFGLAATAFDPPPVTEWVNEVAVPEAALAEMLLEMPYHFISSADRYVASLAVRDSLLDLAYNIWSDRDGDTDPEFLLTASTQPFTPSGLLVDEYDKCTDALDAIGFSLMTGTDLSVLESVTATQRDAGENVALITSVNGNEFIGWQTVSSNEAGDTGTFTNIVRGILDTVPLTHPAGSRVWFFTNGFGVVDEDDPYPTNRTIYAKLLTYNARGTLAIGAADTLDITLASRAMSPYPPGNVKVNGSQCPSLFIEQDVTLTWSHRHRVLQTAAQELVHQDSGDYTATPEGDYIVEIYVGATLHHTFQDFALSSDGYIVEYTFAQREIDDSDLTLPVTFVIKPVNDDDLEGTSRSISFVMTSFALLGEDMPYVPAGAMFPSATSGSSNLNRVAIGASQPDILTLDFDPSSQEFAQFSVMAPEGWTGTEVSFQPIWSHPAAVTNFGVQFGLSAVAFSNDDALAQNFGTAQTSTDTGGTTNDLYAGPVSSAITIAGTPVAGDLIYFRLSRNPADAGDTLAVDARLHGIILNWL